MTRHPWAGAAALCFALPGCDHPAESPATAGFLAISGWRSGEKQAIIGFHLKNPLEGYRRLTFMMLDADIMVVSPSSVWRVLSQTGLLSKWKGKPSKKGHGIRTANGRASSLAHRCFLPQHRRNVLLSVQHPGRFQPVYRELGHPRVDERAGHRDHPARGEGKVPGSAARYS